METIDAETISASNAFFASDAGSMRKLPSASDASLGSSIARSATVAPMPTTTRVGAASPTAVSGMLDESSGCGSPVQAMGKMKWTPPAPTSRSLALRVPSARPLLKE